jgi:hypothetical protein
MNYTILNDKADRRDFFSSLEKVRREKTFADHTTLGACK